jgi:hypothetical protein
MIFGGWASTFDVIAKLNFPELQEKERLIYANLI